MAETLDTGDRLHTYGLDYESAELTRAAADQGIRASDHYVDSHDLLRASSVVGEHIALVQLGVDPGTFFCGAQLAELLRRRERVSPKDLRVGFIHVPPDRSTGPQARAKPQLHDRATNLEMIAQVVAIALRGLTPVGDGAVALSGFGPFYGVADNPTAEFVRDGANLDRMIELAHPGSSLASSRTLTANSGASAALREYSVPGSTTTPPRRIRLFSALLDLAASEGDALEGRYYDSSTVADNFDQLVGVFAGANGGEEPGAILSLGVDSSQTTGSRTPRFKIETQTKGWHRDGHRGRNATAHFRRDLELAQIFMSARAGSSPPLRYAR